MEKTKLQRPSQRVGENVRVLREHAGLTLAQVAQRVTDADPMRSRPMTLNVLSRIETGQRNVPVDELFALATALDVDPDRLLMSPKLVQAVGVMSAIHTWSRLDWEQNDLAARSEAKRAEVEQAEEQIRAAMTDKPEVRPLIEEFIRTNIPDHQKLTLDKVVASGDDTGEH